jgi:predicted XRE-type DNA-binding protein
VKEKKIIIEQGSGNVFADLGYPDAEEHFAKSKLVLAIANALKARNMTQAEAAALMGLDQPKVSKLLRGHHRGYSSDRLLKILNLLGQNVIITIVSCPPAKEPRLGHISVAMAQRA